MAEVTFETTVQKTVIEVEDMTGTTVNVEPTPEVSFNVENGGGGGGSYTLLTESEYQEFRRDMELKILTSLPTVETDPETEEK